MNVHVQHVDKNMLVILSTIPESISIKEYLSELANDYVDESVTKDCALDMPPADYLITNDGDIKARVFRDGELVLSITAQ